MQVDLRSESIRENVEFKDSFLFKSMFRSVCSNPILNLFNSSDAYFRLPSYIEDFLLVYNRYTRYWRDNICVPLDPLCLNSIRHKISVVFYIRRLSSQKFFFDMCVYDHYIKYCTVIDYISLASLDCRSQSLNSSYLTIKESLFNNYISCGSSAITVKSLQHLCFSLCLDNGLFLDIDSSTDSEDNSQYKSFASDYDFFESYDDVYSPTVDDMFSNSLDLLEDSPLAPYVWSDWSVDVVDSLPYEAYEVQSGEIEEKEIRRVDFKNKSKRLKKKIGKITSTVDKLTKNEKKKLLAALAKMDLHSGEVEFSQDSLSIGPLQKHFSDYPEIFRVLLEFIRISSGIYISTSRAQVIQHFFFCGLALGIEFSADIKSLLEGLFLEQQSGQNWPDLIQDTMKFWKDNDVLNSIKKGIIIVVSLAMSKLGMFKDWIPDLASLIGDFKVLNLSAFDIMSYALNVILYLWDRVKLAWHKQSLAALFAAAPNLNDISNRYDSVLSMYPHAMAGKMDELSTFRSFDDFADKVHKLHEDLVVLAKICPRQDVALVNRWKHQITKCLFEIESRYAERSVRECPFSFSLAGSSGVGKTILIPLITKVIAAAYGKELCEADYYYRSSSDDYWSGYHGQFVLVEDEKNAMIASNSTVNENKVTLDVVNNSIMRLNMADLDSKGIFTMRSKIHAMTTNKLDAQASANCNEPAAVLRRSIHIVVEVKKEFCKDNTTMLDSNKCSYDPISDDAWLFTALEVVSTGSTNLGRSSGYAYKIMKNDDGVLINRLPMHDLFLFLGERTRKHIAAQHAIMTNFKSLFDVKLCEHGSGQKICRLCNPDVPAFTYQNNVVNIGHTIINREDVSAIAPSILRPAQYHVQSGLIPGLVVGFFSGYFVKFARDLNHRYNWFSYLCMGGRLLFWKCVLYVLGFFPFIGHNPVNSGLLTLTTTIVGNVRYPNLRAVGRNSLWDWKPYLFVFGAIGYYSIFPLLAFYMLGNYYITSLIVADAFAAGINRVIYQFYRSLDVRGANESLQYWAAMKVRPIFSSKYTYIGVATAVSGALALYKVMHADKYMVQGSSDSKMWNKPFTQPEKIVEERTTTVSEDLVTSLSKRICYMQVYKDGSTKRVPFNIIPLKSGAWIVPYHAFYGIDTDEWLGYEYMDLKFNNAASGANVNRLPIDKQLVKQIPGRDLAIVYIVQTAGHMRDMTGFLTDDHKDCSATYIYRDNLGQLIVNGDNKTRLRYLNMERRLVKWSYSCESPFDTFIGLCGAAQVSNTKNPSIVSIHVLGITGSRSSVCIPLVKKEILPILDSLFSDEMTIQTGSFEQMDLTDGHGDLTISDSRHYKSSLNFVLNGSFQYFGSVPARAKANSTIINTVMSDVVEEVFECKNIFGNPTALRSWKPWYKCADVVTHPIFKDPSLIRLASSDYFEPIMDRLAKKDLLSIKPLGELEVLSGIDGHSFYKHMDIKTSSGYPFALKKGEFITAEYHPDDKVHQWHFVMNSWARSRVDAVLERCRAGLRPNCIYTACLKVEPKKIFEEVDGVWVPKISMPRIFYGASFELIFLMRTYFMPLIDIVQQCLESEISVGINATGPDWGKFAEALQKMSNLIMAADQEKFDQSVTPEELVPIYRFLLRLAMLCGYTSDDLLVMRILIGCVIYPIINFDSDLVSFYTLHASGGFATVQFNCMVNSLRHRTFYFSPLLRNLLRRMDHVLYLRVLSTNFRKWCLCGFFGDDSAVAVSEQLEPYYNLHTFAEFMRTQGVNVTTAQKGEIINGTLPLEDCDYLKRGFRYDTEREVWASPLDENSIMKRLFVVDPSKVLTHSEQCGEAISSSLRDYFQFGRHTFNIRRDQLIEVAKRCSLETFVGGGFPCYDDFVLEYKDKYEERTIPQPCGM